MHPSYFRVFLTFARNSLVRDMSFRTNFILQCFSSMSWALMNWGLFKIIYQFTGEIGKDSGWHENEFFIFLGTVWIINSLIQTFFMANAEQFSELIRTGNLDFALLKPIDTQFLISFPRVNWAQGANGLLGVALIIYSLYNLQQDPSTAPVLSPLTILTYLFFVGCGAVIMYSVMIALSSTSIWFGRNQNLYNFWFTSPTFIDTRWKSINEMELGMPCGALSRSWCQSWWSPTFRRECLRSHLGPLGKPGSGDWRVLQFWATIWSLLASRWVFKKALLSYRSASS